jgi:DNA polymerase III subunit gamma/tau
VSEVALYRKYRSYDFADVIGQKHVVTTLTNALDGGRISHAYLFTGPRGVGKTSVARLLAKAVNCQAEKGPKPCNKCEVCSIPLPSNMDIIEIDAASNRRIDEMRDLREKVNLTPSRSKYKVYIIDEVHMLTTEAFNALLKTLEEPPSHVIFVLATTEAHKLPETIISRTQRFSFHPISDDDVIARLKHIAKQEKISIHDEALGLIAQTARGGMRDAVSMLDQVANTAEKQIEADHVREALGWGNLGLLMKLNEAIANQQPQEVLASLDTLLSEGAQVGQIINQLLEVWRQIMRVQAGVQSSSDERLQALAGKLELGSITQAIDELSKASVSPLPLLALEGALIRLSMPQQASAAPTPAVTATATKAVVQPPVVEVAPKPAEKSSNLEGDLWPKALLLIKSHNNSLYALVRSCGITITEDALQLTCRFNFHKDRLMEPKNRQTIEQVLAKVYGRPLRLDCQLEAGQAVGVAANTESELVSSALEILGGEVVDG